VSEYPSETTEAAEASEAAALAAADASGTLPEAENERTLDPEYLVNQEALNQYAAQIDDEVGKLMISNMDAVVDFTIDARLAIVRKSTGLPDYAGQSDWYKRWSAERFVKMFPPLSDDEADKQLANRIVAYSLKTGKTREVPSLASHVYPIVNDLPADLTALEQGDLRAIAAKGSAEVLYRSEHRFEAITDALKDAGVSDSDLGAFEDGQEKLQRAWNEANAIRLALGDAERVYRNGKRVVEHSDPGDVTATLYPDAPEQIRSMHREAAKQDRERERERQRENLNRRAKRVMFKRYPLAELIASGLTPPTIAPAAERGSRENGEQEKPTVASEHTAIVDALMAAELPFHEKVNTLRDAIERVLAEASPEALEKMAGQEKQTIAASLAQSIANLERLRSLLSS
jgi:hypothetical protein